MLLTMLNPFAASGEVIDGARARTLVKQSAAVLVDVREPQEVRQGGQASGAINLPLGELAQRATPATPTCHPDLGTGRPVIVYCATGARSGMAAKILKKLGHAEVYNMGSLAAWTSAGGAVQR